MIIKETLSHLNDTCRKSCFLCSGSFHYGLKEKSNSVSKITLFHVFNLNEKINNFMKTLQHLSKQQSNFTALQGCSLLYPLLGKAKGRKVGWVNYSNLMCIQMTFLNNCMRQEVLFSKKVQNDPLLFSNEQYGKCFIKTDLLRVCAPAYIANNDRHRFLKFLKVL